MLLLSSQARVWYGVEGFGRKSERRAWVLQPVQFSLTLSAGFIHFEAEW